MSERKTGPAANPARAAREKRLAEALRANLRRRKQTSPPDGSDGTAGTAERPPENRSRSDENKDEPG